MKRIKRLVFRLKSNIFWKSVIVLVSGTALAQIMGVFTTPIVSRLYEPRAFGEYAIIISTSSIILSIVTLGLNSAIMVPKSDDESKEIFTVTFLSILVLSTLIVFVIISISSFIQLIDSGLNYILTWIIIYGFVIINSVKGIMNIYVNRKGLNRVLYYNSLIGALTTLCITIPLGFLNLGSLGLIIATLIGGIASIIQMLYHVNPFKKISTFSIYKNVFNRYKDFILYQYPSNFIENFAIQVPTQAFSAFFGNVNLGAYSMNEKILGIPIRLIGAPINTIYFRTASEYHKQGKNLALFTFSLITKIMIVAFIPIVLTIIWGEEIFSWILGPNWSEAGKLAGYLIVQYVFMFCATCTSYLRVVIGKQRVNLVVSLLRLVIICLSIFAGIFFVGDLFNTILFFTLGSSLFLIIDMAINFYCLGKYYVRYTVFAFIYISLVFILWVFV